MKLTARLGAISAVSLLAACGGGTSPTYNAMFSDFNSLTAAAVGNDEVAPTQIRTAGSANYDGVLFFNLENGDIDQQGTILGTLSIAANFIGESFSGSASNFRDRNENSYDGTLTLANSPINRLNNSAVALDTNITGMLTNGPVGPMTVNARFVGDFYGTEERFIIGHLERGTVTVGTDMIPLSNTNSGAIAER